MLLTTNCYPELNLCQKLDNVFHFNAFQNSTSLVLISTDGKLLLTQIKWVSKDYVHKGYWNHDLYLWAALRIVSPEWSPGHLLYVASFVICLSSFLDCELLSPGLILLLALIVSSKISCMWEAFIKCLLNKLTVSLKKVLNSQIMLIEEPFGLDIHAVWKLQHVSFMWKLAWWPYSGPVVPQDCSYTITVNYICLCEILWCFEEIGMYETKMYFPLKCPYLLYQVLFCFLSWVVLIIK